MERDEKHRSKLLIYKAKLRLARFLRSAFSGTSQPPDQGRSYLLEKTAIVGAGREPDRLNHWLRVIIMQLSDDTAKKFPKMLYYVKINMPQVAEVQKIVNAIQKLAGKTTKETIKNALKWGQGPTITVVKNLRCAGKKAYGCYTWNSNELRVDEKLVRDFEAGKGLVSMKNGKQVYLLGVTILHELTHWADAQDGVDDEVPGDPSNEEGEAYEKGVYGEVLG